MNCDGFCTAPSFPALLFAADMLALGGLVMLGRYGMIPKGLTGTSRAVATTMTMTLAFLVFGGNIG